MGSETSSLAKQAKVLAGALKGLGALQAEFMAASEQIQELILFGAHPELTALDDELDTMYRGQI